MQTGSSLRRCAVAVAALAAMAGGERTARAEGAEGSVAPPPVPGGPRPPPSPPVTPYVKRGMLYGPGQAGLGLTVGAVVAAAARSSADASLGIALGLTSRVSLETSLGTLTLAPDLRYRSPEAGLWVGLVDTPAFELDTTLKTTFGAAGEPFVRSVEPGVVAVLRPDDHLRVDISGYVPASPSGAGLRVPFQLALQINPYLHAALTSGINVARLGETPPSIPLGVSLGVTVPLDHGGYLAIAPSLSWPDLAGGDASTPAAPRIGVTFALITP